jgi:hypothetical protein
MSHDHDAPSVGERARAAGLARGTLSCWKSRGVLPNAASAFDEVLSAALVARLAAFGLKTGEAAALVAEVRRRWWPAAGGKAGPAYLVATRAEGGRWKAQVCATPPTTPGPNALLVDVGRLAQGVLARLARPRA